MGGCAPVHRIPHGSGNQREHGHCPPRPVHDSHGSERGVRVEVEAVALDEHERRQVSGGTDTSEQLLVLLLRAEAHAARRVSVGDEVDETVAQVAARHSRRSHIQGVPTIEYRLSILSLLSILSGGSIQR